MSGDHYQRWDDRDAVEEFAKKAPTDFFRSETVFLEEIAGQVDSVLDVGCAAGRYIELLNRFGIEAAYTGIDLSPSSIERGRAAYPDVEFVLGNALEIDPGRTFDLVNATGVCQHEPRFEDLIRQMIAWSRRYVLFDVKFAAIDDHLIDIERSYGGRENRLYFILLSLPPFLDFLKTIPGIGRIRIYGYVTPTNARTVVPENISVVHSAGVLLERAPGVTSGGAEVVVDVPSSAWPGEAPGPETPA